MKRRLLLVVAVVVAALALSVGPAGAINDPFVPGDNCAPAQAQAVGHPAEPVLVGTPAGAPGPGNADQGLTHNNAEPNCAGLTP